MPLANFTYYRKSAFRCQNGSIRYGYTHRPLSLLFGQCIGFEFYITRTEQLKLSTLHATCFEGYQWLDVSAFYETGEMIQATGGLSVLMICVFQENISVF